MWYFSVFLSIFVVAKVGKCTHKGASPAHSYDFFPRVKGFGFFDIFTLPRLEH